MPQRTVFPLARDAFSESYDSLSDVEFAEAIAAATGMSAVDVESWLSNLGKTFQQMAPGMLQGAVSGASTGAALGPWGALIGGLGGAVAGGLSSSGKAAPAPTPAGAGAAPAPAGAPAAGTLMQMLSNPQVQQALMSMLAGRGGRESIDVADRAVPVEAFAEAIRELADVAIAQYQAAGESTEGGSWNDYLESKRSDGNDTGNALVRGVLLAKLLEPAPYGFFPAVPAVPVATTAAVPAAPAAPGAPAAAQPTVAPGGYEPAPAYSTPDLGIGVPITLPTQAEAWRRALAQHEFAESIDAIFELNGYA